MTKITKKKRLIQNLINREKFYDFNTGIDLLKKTAISKFVESVDIAIHLNIDTKKSDQNIRGTTILPHSLGKTIKVAVFTQGNNVNIAKKCGADFVGLQDLIEDIKQNGIKFDVAIATPDSMLTVSKIGSILGPKGLMPNPKLGTVTEDITKAIKNVKFGQIFYKTDKNGIIHSTIGKINFLTKNIQDNLNSVLHTLKKLKPNNVKLKGNYIKKIILSTTMGVSVKIDLNNFHSIIN